MNDATECQGVALYPLLFMNPKRFYRLLFFKNINENHLSVNPQSVY